MAEQGKLWALWERMKDVPTVTVTEHGHPSKARVLFNGVPIKVVDMKWQAKGEKLPIVTLRIHAKLEVVGVPAKKLAGGDRYISFEEPTPKLIAAGEEEPADE